MDIDTQDDGCTPIARTKRYERDRGFTRAAFLVVPDWEAPLRHYDDDALAARYERESERDVEYVSIAAILAPRI